MDSKRFKYSEEDMRGALMAVENGMSINSASKCFKIPRMTLSDKVKGKTPIGRKMGPPSILSNEEEMLLERWILHLASLRFPIRKEQLLDSVQLLSKQLGKQDKFPNGRPGRHWYEAFLRRHPLITERSAQNLSARRAEVSEKNLRNWFAEVKSFMDENNLLEVFEDPRRIFNCDETAFFLSPKDNRVLARKGQKTVHTVINSDEKECITTLLMGNAAGDIAPPMVVINLKRIPKKLSQSVPESWAIGRSDNGWMTGETFFEYFANVFHPWLVEKKIEFPVIVFCDGHSSHLTMALSEFCKKNRIELVALYPNATQILQPMDVAVFHPLKVSWRKAVYAYRINNTGLPLKRDNFCPILNDALKSITPDILKNGFRRCGLCPFDPDALDYTQLPRDQVSKNATRPLDPKIVEHLIFFEDNISKEKLALFNNSGETWTGALEDKSLYYFWRILKQKTVKDKQTKESQEINEPNVSVIGNNYVMNSGRDSNQNDIPPDIDILNENSSSMNIEPDIGTTNIPEYSFVCTEYELNRNLEWLDSDILLNDANSNDVYEVTETGDLVKISIEEKNDETAELTPEAMNDIGKSVESNNYEEILKELNDNVVSEKSTNNKTNSIVVDTDDGEVRDGKNGVTPDSTKNDLSTTRCNDIMKGESKIISAHLSPPEASLTEPTILNDFPTPFKKTLFWPSTPTTDSNSQKRKPKEKVPAVATSQQWQQYISIKEKGKADKIKRIEENKRRREETSKMREEAAKKKKETKLGSREGKKQCKGKENRSVDTSDRWYCKICEDEFEQDMIQCLACKCWIHEICANVSKGAKKFFCSSCK